MRIESIVIIEAMKLARQGEVGGSARRGRIRETGTDQGEVGGNEEKGRLV
jgi:hypothetical protein